MDEVQYCVVLEDEPDKGLKHYTWVSKEQVKNAMKILDDNADNLSLDCTVETTVFKHPTIHACFDKRRIGSLIFSVPSKDLGNWAAEKTGLPWPFFEVKSPYHF